jgi:hypothetical protein
VHHAVTIRDGLVCRQRSDFGRVVVDPDEIHALDRDVAALGQAKELERPDDPLVLRDFVIRTAK